MRMQDALYISLCHIPDPCTSQIVKNRGGCSTLASPSCNNQVPVDPTSPFPRCGGGIATTGPRRAPRGDRSPLVDTDRTTIRPCPLDTGPPPLGGGNWTTRMRAHPNLPSIGFRDRGLVPWQRQRRSRVLIGDPSICPFRAWALVENGDRSCVRTLCRKGPCNAMAWHRSWSSRPLCIPDITWPWRLLRQWPRRRRGACPLPSHRRQASLRPRPQCQSPPPSCSPSR